MKYLLWILLVLTGVGLSRTGQAEPFFRCEEGMLRYDIKGTPRSCSRSARNVVEVGFDQYECKRGTVYNSYEKKGTIAATPCPSFPPAETAKVWINCFQSSVWLGTRVSADVFFTFGDAPEFGKEMVHVPFTYAVRSPVLRFNQANGNGFLQNMIGAYGFMLKQGRHTEAQGQGCAIQCMEREMRALQWLDEDAQRALQSYRKQIDSVTQCRSSVPTLPPADAPKGVFPEAKAKEVVVPKDIQTLLNQRSCRDCRCQAPSGQTLCKAMGYGWRTPDGKAVAHTTDSRAKHEMNMCMTRFVLDGAVADCATLNHSSCTGFGFVGTEAQPKDGGFGRAGWQSFTNGIVTCSAGPPRSATIQEYQGANRFNFLTPIEEVEARGPIPLGEVPRIAPRESSGKSPTH